MTPWKLPFLVAAIAVPVLLAFYLGGPGVGVAIGALAAVALIAYAAGQRPRGKIGEDPAGDSEGRLLVVLATALEDPVALDEVAQAARRHPAGEAVVLAPARIGFLDRWASDVEGAREAAQRRLVISIASLAAAGVAAEARVGDEDLVQAVEDQLARFAATDVVLVSADDEEGCASAAEELRSRLRPRFRWVRVRDPAAR